MRQPPDYYMLHQIIIPGVRDYLDWRMGSAGTAELFDIAVYSSRRQGTGKRMIGMMIDQLPSDVRIIYALCRASNEAGIKFYTALGFHPLLVEKFYKFDGIEELEDAVMFKLCIKEFKR